MQNASPIKKGCDSPVVKVSDHGRHVMSSSPVPLKTHRVGQRCTLNLLRAETFWATAHNRSVMTSVNRTEKDAVCLLHEDDRVKVFYTMNEIDRQRTPLLGIAPNWRGACATLSRVRSVLLCIPIAAPKGMNVSILAPHLTNGRQAREYFDACVMRGEAESERINCPRLIEALCVLKCGNVLARVHLDNWSGNRRGGISKAKGTTLLTGGDLSTSVF
ncbi:hypothetical protein TNCV_1139311 [Trichonephila clavipes]|nr:hypothetical protein TNCV_1139311 [Trichonephila clavipes]